MINSYYYCKYYYYHYHYYFYCYYCYSCYHCIIAIIVVYIVAGSHQRWHHPNGTDSSVEKNRSRFSGRQTGAIVVSEFVGQTGRADFTTWLVGGWPTPLKNDGVRQLVLSFPIYGKSCSKSCSSHHLNQWMDGLDADESHFICNGSLMDTTGFMASDFAHGDDVTDVHSSVDDIYIYIYIYIIINP